MCLELEHHLSAVCKAAPYPSVVTSANAAPQETTPLPELYGVNGILGSQELYNSELVQLGSSDSLRYYVVLHYSL
jgi:hypothetical protein